MIRISYICLFLILKISHETDEMYLFIANSETPCRYKRNATLYSAYRKPGEELFDYAVVVERILSLLLHSRAIEPCPYMYQVLWK